jgi:hypothetical protein
MKLGANLELPYLLNPNSKQKQHGECAKSLM